MNKEDLYICSKAQEGCKHKCKHSTPHNKMWNCLNGSCYGKKIPCIKEDDLNFIKEEDFRI